MNVLILETTCDETAAAVVDDKLCVRGAVVASQHALHQRFGGIVPEVASRAHVERILPAIDEALRQAGLGAKEISAVAVANTPGLAGSLLVGLAAAKALCVALDIPLVAFNHLQAHVYACRLAHGPQVFPCVALVVSGGHTALFRCAGPLEFELLGSTIDDAAGEAFDKVASLLGLPYPGGPAIQAAAQRGNPRAFDLPRAFIKEKDRLEFSFSGLKTAVRYLVADLSSSGPLARHHLADVAASFQAAVVDVLVAKALRAVERTGFTNLCVGGGVAANTALREALAAEAAPRGVTVYFAPLSLCTDNAVMGAIALERIRAGQFAPLDLDAIPGPIR
jgi:N6-L-threonylcarbamoyladenine synthase